MGSRILKGKCAVMKFPLYHVKNPNQSSQYFDLLQNYMHTYLVFLITVPTTMLAVEMSVYK